MKIKGFRQVFKGKFLLCDFFALKKEMARFQIYFIRFDTASHAILSGAGPFGLAQNS